MAPLVPLLAYILQVLRLPRTRALLRHELELTGAVIKIRAQNRKKMHLLSRRRLIVVADPAPEPTAALSVVVPVLNSLAAACNQILEVSSAVHEIRNACTGQKRTQS